MWSACAQPNGPDPLATDIPIQRLSAEPYSFEWNSGFRVSNRQVIRDLAAWGKAWATIHENKGTKPPLPDIDFTTDMVVVAALGARPSGGYNVLVKGASGSADVITVRLESTSPGKGCAVLTVQTQPVDVAKIPRSSAYVQFEETATVRNCG